MRILVAEIDSENSLFGGLAQLARALDLHSRGRGFDSHILHNQLFLLKMFFDILKKIHEIKNF